MVQKKRRTPTNHFSMRDALRDQRHVKAKPQRSTNELLLLNDIKRRGYVQIDPNTMGHVEYQRQYAEYRDFADRHGVVFIDGGNWFAVGTQDAVKQLAED